MDNRIMKRLTYVIALFLISGVLYAGVIRSLSTRFADVILSGMSPGMIYSLKQYRNMPYRVMNKSEDAVDVEVIVEKPVEGQLKEGYEPVPDVSWLKLFPVTFHLEPGETTDCDIIISIPNEERYANRHFQAMIITKTIEAPDARGVAISFALASRLRFSTGPTPKKVMREYRKKVLEALKLDLTPLSLFLSELPVGKKVKLDGEDFSTLQLINRGKEAYKIEFHLVDPERYGLTQDYEPIPKDIKVRFKERKVKAKKRSISDVIMEVEIPDKEEFYGKSFAFVVIASILELEFPVELYSRVYFKTEEKNEKEK